MKLMRLTMTAFASLTLMATGCDDKPKGQANSAEPAKAESPKKAQSPKKAETKVAAPKAGNTATKVGLDTGGKALGGAAVKLNSLVFGGTGYDASFNEIMDSWTVERWAPNADGGNDQLMNIYVDPWDDDRPTDVAAFAAKLPAKDYIDMGSTWQVDKKNAVKGGWLITGTTNDGEDTQVAFVARLDALNAMCRGYVDTEVPEAKRIAVRDDAIKACFGSHLKK